MEMVSLPINRFLLKTDAKTRIARSKPNALLVGAILMAAFLVIEMLIPGVLGLTNLPIEIPERIDSYDAYMAASEQASEQLLAFFESYHPSALALGLTGLLLLMHEMLRVGFSVYGLHIARDEKAEVANLLDGFSMFGRALVLIVLQWVIVSALSMLLIFPGVIMAYRYRQAVYLLIEHPDYSPVRCLQESARLMRGRKAELFVLDLSFLGWVLAQSFVPYVGTLIGVWVLPYKEITYANYYCILTGPKTTPDGKPFEEGDYTDIPDA